MIKVTAEISTRLHVIVDVDGIIVDDRESVIRIKWDEYKQIEKLVLLVQGLPMIATVNK